MHHPRRHEVFRDVGSALRDKDEPDYVEVIDDTLEDDAAILVCSDGLTDMIPSTTIERVVRQHAGDAAAVTTALVAAANEAGGRDNVTVVYAEAPGFAAAVQGRARLPFRCMRRRQPADAATVVDDAAGRWARACWLGRTTWFVVGTVLGVLGALLLAWRLSTEAPVGGRTIVAAPAGVGDGRHAGGGRAGGPAQATSSASSPARMPSRLSSPRACPSGRAFPAARCSSGRRVRPASGSPSSRRETAAPSPASGSPRPRRRRCRSGVRVGGQGRSIELLQVDGPVTAGVDIRRGRLGDAAGQSLRRRRSGHRAGRAQPARGHRQCLRRARTSSPSLRRCLAGRRRGSEPCRTARARHFAMHVEDGARVVLNRNVFAGFGPTPSRA